MKYIQLFESYFELNETKHHDLANEMVSEFVEGTYEGEKRPNSKTMELAINGLKKLSAKLKVDLKDLFLASGSSGSDYIFIEPVCIEKMRSQSVIL